MIFPIWLSELPGIVMYSEDKKYVALERACRNASSKMYCKFSPISLGRRLIL